MSNGVALGLTLVLVGVAVALGLVAVLTRRVVTTVWKGSAGETCTPPPGFCCRGC